MSSIGELYELYPSGGISSRGLRSQAPSDITLIVHLAMRVCCYKSGPNLLGVNKEGTMHAAGCLAALLRC